jgi:rhodanese-related sulfurtransferase
MAHRSSPSGVPEVPTVTAQEAKELVLGDKKVPYLDVRTPQEFARGHPPGALNVPYLYFKEDGSAEVLTRSSIFATRDRDYDRCHRSRKAPRLRVLAS